LNPARANEIMDKDKELLIEDSVFTATPVIENGKLICYRIGFTVPDPKDDALLTSVAIGPDPSPKTTIWAMKKALEDWGIPLVEASWAEWEAFVNAPVTHSCRSCRKPVTPNTYNFGDRMRDFCPTCGEEVTE
jgi:hypothetical protein